MTDSSRVWIPELVERIAIAMPPSEAACTLRLVNKVTAAQFRGRREFTTVRLSQPVPPHAFAHKWAALGAMRQLTLQQRHRLLCLTAASGVVPNMEVALASVGFIPTELKREEVLEAAADANALEVCDWLLRRGYTVSTAALNAAARSGQRPVCELFLAHAECSASMVCAAARGGHPDLMEWLLQRLPQRHAREGPGPASASPSLDAMDCLGAHESGWLLRGAAEGCDIQKLQSLYRRCLGALSQHGTSGQGLLAGRMLPGAAASPSPDWQAKVEWIETLFDGPGYKQTETGVLGSAASAPDAPNRLAWLQQRGYRLSAIAWRHVVAAVRRTRSVPVVEYLVADGAYPGNLCHAVLRLGLVHLLSASARDRLSFEPSDAAVAVFAAAEDGDLSLLQWAVEHLGASVPSGDCVADPACMAHVARTGNVEMLAWMQKRGCPLDAATFTAAVEGGCEEALEWLAERGCPITTSGDAYCHAARNGDLTTLRCLRRLGCPWGPAGKVFTACVQWGCPLPVLRWLAEAGCPVDREAAVRAATQRGSSCPADVLAWVAEKR